MTRPHRSYGDSCVVHLDARRAVRRPVFLDRVHAAIFARQLAVVAQKLRAFSIGEPALALSSQVGSKFLVALDPLAIRRWHLHRRQWRAFGNYFVAKRTKDTEGRRCCASREVLWPDFKTKRPRERLAK